MIGTTKAPLDVGIIRQRALVSPGPNRRDTIALCDEVEALRAALAFKQGTINDLAALVQRLEDQQ